MTEEQPKWTKQDMAFWSDMFEGFAGQLIEAHLEQINKRVEDTGRAVMPWEDTARIDDGLIEAGKMADRALQELQYRFRPEKAPARPAPRTTTRRRGR